MSKYLDENGLLYLWEKITDAIDPKADKVPEVNHGTSDTTFTLTPNIMHIWGEIATLNLTLSADSNSVLDEYMFTFTCPSAAATNLTLPSSIKWIQQPELQAGKTYQVSIVNGLAGYLTDDMPATGQDNIIETVKVNGTALTPDANKAVDITVPQGTVTSVTVNGSNYTPDTNGLVNLGTISGGSGGGGEYNVIEGVTFNGTTAPITNKIAAITYTAPTLSKGTTTGSGNAVTDISVSGHTVTLTKGTTFLTSHQDISGKANDADVVHKTGYEVITGSKTITNQLNFVAEGQEYDNYITSAAGTLILKGEDGINVNGDLNLINGSSIIVDNIYAKTAADRSNAKIFSTNGSIIDLPSLSKGTTTGSGNAVTDISVSGHTITLTKGSTFLQSGSNAMELIYTGASGDVVVSGDDVQECISALDSALSDKANKTNTVSTVTYDTTNDKLTKTINGTTTDIVTATTIVTDGLSSGTNIKTVNGGSIVGSGNLNIAYQDGRSNEYYVTAGNTVNDNITALDDSLYSVESSLNALRNSLATVYSGSSAPSSSLGSNGDIYIKTS